MIGAYASLLILLLLAALIGQALISVSLGVRRGAPIDFAWLAPAVGLGGDARARRRHRPPARPRLDRARWRC